MEFFPYESVSLTDLMSPAPLSITASSVGPDIKRASPVCNKK